MRIGVYGLGRFGAFWAALLSRKFSVTGYNRNPGRSVPEGITPGTEEDVLSCDVLFLCVAISAMEEVLQRIGPRIRPGTLVMDTCSVKVLPVQSLLRHLPGNASIIGTHPMFGPDSARAGVQGLPLVLCPVRNNREEFDFWKEKFLSYGLKVLTLSPEEHDREAAYTQGITHFIGRLLSDLNLKPSEIGTMGYNRILQVMEQTCNDPWQLFLDLQRYNPYTRNMRDDLQQSLQRILGKLEASLDSPVSPGYDEKTGNS